MSGHGEKLTRKQEAAIAALLTCPTLEKAAAAAGVSISTIRRWQALPDFQAAHRRAKTRLVSDALTRIQASTGQAVKTLRRLMRCGHPPTECRAAAEVLKQAVQAVELQEVVARIEELEEAVRQQPGRQPFRTVG